MLVQNFKRKNRSAKIIVDNGSIVLYNALENGKIFYNNMVKSSDRFWAEYTPVA